MTVTLPKTPPFDGRYPALCVKVWQQVAAWDVLDWRDWVDTLKYIGETTMSNALRPGGVQVDVAEFRGDWRIIRALVPLQLRLLMEQRLQDMGGEWAKLVSGFLPIKGDLPRPSPGDDRAERSRERQAARDARAAREAWYAKRRERGRRE